MWVVDYLSLHGFGWKALLFANYPKTKEGAQAFLVKRIFMDTGFKYRVRNIETGEIL